MKKRNCLIIFIVMIIMLTIPTLKVNALVTVGQLPDLPTLTHNNPYTIIKDKDDVIRLYIIPTSNLTNINGEKGIITIPSALHFGGGFSTILGTSYSYHVYYYKIVDNAWKYVGYSSYGYNYSPSDFGISTEDYSLDPSIIEDYLDDVLIYNNINYYYPHNDEYVKRFQKKNYLDYSVGFAEDLDGTTVYNLRLNANNYDPNYQYLIKTEQETNWTDITENLNNVAYQYDTIIYYNTTIHMKVLNSSGDVLETKECEITDLGEYGFNITHSPANDLLGREVEAISIDTRRIYSNNYIYQYSYDNQVFYDMNITPDNKLFILNHALNIPIYLRILNLEGDIIYEQLYEENFENLNKKIAFTEIAEIVGTKKQIRFEVNFLEYAWYQDVYNFRFFIKNEEYGEDHAFKEFIITEDNYMKTVYVKVMVDNNIIEEYNHRIGTIEGTGFGSDFDFNTMYDNVLENELNENFKNNDYTTISGVVTAVINFINTIKNIVIVFFELVMYFFDKLNTWIRTCIISLFSELVIFKIVKAVRK